ncbi:MAG: outer membrane beta-barrel protein [Bacteroidetes bacterium]|nr:outer membrane beta-barrel protein [Bacteroidota bacterium]
MKARYFNANTSSMALPVATLLLLLLMAAGRCAAQSDTSDYEIWRAGLFGAYQAIDYNASMTGLPGVPSCCPEYRDGSGTGYALGLSGEVFPLKQFSVGVHLLYARYDGTLRANENELVTSDHDTITAVFGHTIEVTLPAIAAELFVGYEPLSGLHVVAGARTDFMLNGTYRQSEEILSPSNIRYENDSRQRLQFEGTIGGEHAVGIGLYAGARYDIPLNRTRSVLLAPEVDLWTGVNNILNTESWKMRGLRIGLNLCYSMHNSPVVQPPTPVPAPPPPHERANTQGQ